MSEQKSSNKLIVYPIPAEILARLASIPVKGSATATAIANAAVLISDEGERQDWQDAPEVLARLEITHLRMLAETPEAVIPRIALLTGWHPKRASDQTLRLAAAAVLAEKVGARDRSHNRVLAWIAIIGPLVAFALGFWLGKL